MKKLLSITVVALFFVGCSKEGEYSSSIARLGLNFTAKSMCSCLWVSENSEEFCRDYTELKQVTPSIAVDQQAKLVETSLFWILRAKAKFIDDKRGCQLQDAY